MGNSSLKPPRSEAKLRAESWWEVRSLYCRYQAHATSPFCHDQELGEVVSCTGQSKALPAPTDLSTHRSS